MDKKELTIIGLSAGMAPDGKNYTLMLQEKDGARRIPITIGAAEGQSIAMVMERQKPTRPLTHDLFKTTLNMLDAKLNEVRINNVEDGTFYAQLLLTDSQNNSIFIDARPSDAVALAVRFGCAIYTYEFVIASASVAEGNDALSPERSSFVRYTLRELEQLLASSVAKEDYANAALVRDIIESRKNPKAGKEG